MNTIMEPAPKHGKIGRSIGALACGLLAGILLSGAIRQGLEYRFPDENPGELWGLFIWGEHWVLRIAASLLSAMWAGFITGVIARQNGKLLASIALLPSLIGWLCIVFIAVTGSMPFINAGNPLHVSIGNKVSASIILLGLLPATRSGAILGEDLGSSLGDHFDSRPHTLLGIKWYHYLWMPFWLNLLAVQITWSGLYFFIWVKALWQSGFSFLGSILPLIFTGVLYWSFALIGDGLLKAYDTLSGLQPTTSKKESFFAVPSSRRKCPILDDRSRDGKEIQAVEFGRA